MLIHSEHTETSMFISYDLAVTMKDSILNTEDTTNFLEKKNSNPLPRYLTRDGDENEMWMLWRLPR